MKKTDDSLSVMKKRCNQDDEPRKILTLSGLKDPRQLRRQKK